ncbi:putative N-acetyltransferase [Quillaja saponaria]|uniref:N-acetyltransferase n=1 Tax=Quillaja saponaria TaxID=32244 RepID=A0AAD7KNQ9_QUISA|nr:putative N-acetyltransferase [Quillaja saponaria]
MHLLPLPSSSFLFFPKKKMLLRGMVSSPVPTSLHLKTATFHRKVAVSAQISTNKYSISDESLESRGFLLRRTIDHLNLDHLNSVFVSVGFPKRDPKKILVALENTDSLLWVEYKKTERPVAFARATGDGVFNAIIWDVVVDPSFQGIGLGKAVMERLIEELLGKGICNIALYSEPRVLGFYRPLGFVAGSGWSPRDGVFQKTEKEQMNCVH